MNYFKNTDSSAYIHIWVILSSGEHIILCNGIKVTDSNIHCTFAVSSQTYFIVYIINIMIQ